MEIAFFDVRYKHIINKMYYDNQIFYNVPIVSTLWSFSNFKNLAASVMLRIGVQYLDK